MHLLFAVEERNFIKAGQVGRQALGCLGPPRGLAVGRLGHRAEDFDGRGGIVEARVGDEFQLGLEKPPGPHLVDEPVDARTGPPILAGQNLGRDPHAKAPVDLSLGVVVERGQRVGENGPIGMIAVMSFQRQSDRFCGACHLTCDPPGDLDQAGLAWSNERHAAGATDDFIPLRLGQLPEP